MENNNVQKENVKIVVPLKYLSNSWRTLDISLINCEVSLTSTWYENCVLTSRATRSAVAAQGSNPEVARINNQTGGAKIEIEDTILYVPVVTLSTEDDNKLLEQLKKGFKRTIKWNKYGLEMTNQDKTNNLNYLIDPTFNKFNKLFVLSFENKDDRTSFSKYYTPSGEIKHLN